VSRKPLVIVTGPDKTLRFGWWAARFMLWQYGLRAHYLTPRNPARPDAVAGIVIGGGDDVRPEHYGASGDAGSRYDPERDELELDIFRDAYASGIPVLGICRGSQLINIALGGDLHPDLRPHRRQTPNRNTIFKIKDALLEPSTRLQAIVGSDRLRVNSLHNQAINVIAEPLRLAASDRDGFVQAVEHREQDFVLGVQWHPEYLPYARHHRKLFAAFANAVRATGKTLK
jgi:putative glutamine amidotransferase